MIVLGAQHFAIVECPAREKATENVIDWLYAKLRTPRVDTFSIGLLSGVHGGSRQLRMDIDPSQRAYVPGVRLGSICWSDGKFARISLSKSKDMTRILDGISKSSLVVLYRSHAPSMARGTI